MVEIGYDGFFIARLRGLWVLEIPIEWHYRELSRVSPLTDSLRMLRDILRTRAKAMRGRCGARQAVD